MQVSNKPKRIIKGTIFVIIFGIMLIERRNTFSMAILWSVTRFNNLLACNNQEIPIKIKNIRKKDFNNCVYRYISNFFIFYNEY